jgi:hypothetical protein
MVKLMPNYCSNGWKGPTVIDLSPKTDHFKPTKMGCSFAEAAGHVARNSRARPILRRVAQIAQSRFRSYLPPASSLLLSLLPGFCYGVGPSNIYMASAFPSCGFCFSFLSSLLAPSLSLPTLPGDGHRREQGGAPRPSSSSSAPVCRPGKRRRLTSPGAGGTRQRSRPAHGAARLRQRWLS